MSRRVRAWHAPPGGVGGVAVEGGVLPLPRRRPRLTPPVPPELDGEEHALLACPPAPAGHARRMPRLPVGRLVKLEDVNAVSHRAVRRA